MPLPDGISEDLNLLVPLEALLVERHVTRAAARAGLTQPAMSRALGRLRALTHDELLIRSGGRYELTPLGRDLLDRVRATLPAVRAIFHPGDFDPASAEAQFRVAGTDYAALVFGPGLVARLRRDAPGCALLLRPWTRRIGEQLASGEVDAMIVAVAPPSGLRHEPVLAETMVCVTDRRRSTTDAPLTLDDYLGLRHLSVTTEGGDQATIDGRLAAAGLGRTVTVSAPTHQSALELLRGTDLVATLPRRALPSSPSRHGLRVVDAPVELRSVTLSLVWHPRTDHHGAQSWLRQQIREVAATLH